VDNRERVNGVLKQVIKEDRRITPEQTLVEDLGLNSLQIMEVLGLIENEFNVFVPTEMAIPIKTVGDMYKAIDEITRSHD